MLGCSREEVATPGTLPLLVGKSFAEGVGEWHDFYLLAGTAAATLTGLLFVAVSLNYEVFAHEARNDLRALARQTFNRFLLVIEFALIFLIPGLSQLGLALPLLAITGIGVFVHLHATPYARSASVGWRSRTQRMYLPLASYVALAGVAIALMFVRRAVALDLLYWLVAVFVILITSAARNAWDFLMVVVLERDREGSDRS